MTKFLRRLSRDEIGTSMVEYSVLLAIVLGVAVATLTALGANITRIFGLVNTLLAAVVAG
jgi:Flp pilus assembly pilin Flp